MIHEQLREEFIKDLELEIKYLISELKAEGDDSRIVNILELVEKCLDTYADTKLAKVAEEIEKQVSFIEEGIQACKDDSSEKDCIGDELHYIFGKSQALKIMKKRLSDSTSLVREQMNNK